MVFIESTTFARSRAKILRQRQNDAENLLWGLLRAKRFHNYKFRRQVPIGPYIVDFLCFDEKFIIEIDGNAHYKKGSLEYDHERTQYLYSEGFQIFRCNHREFMKSPDTILRKIYEHLQKAIM